MLFFLSLLQQVNQFAEESLNPAWLEVATGLALWVLFTVVAHDVISWWWKTNPLNDDEGYAPRVKRNNDDET